jgi:hypothetical protein
LVKSLDEACEGQQQFNQPTEASQLQLRVNCEMVTIQEGREHGSRRIRIAGTRYPAMPGEDIEALLFAGVICRVCSSVKLLQLLLVTLSIQ